MPEAPDEFAAKELASVLVETRAAAGDMVSLAQELEVKQVRPPASNGVLCSKSDLVAGRRHPGPVQVAVRRLCRILAQ